MSFNTLKGHQQILGTLHLANGCVKKCKEFNLCN